MRGLGSRPLFLNGSRWAPLEIDGSRTDALVPVETEMDDDRLQPRLGPLWASWSAICNGSMTAGYFGTALSACTTKYAVAIENLDEDGKRATAFRLSRRNRVALMADLLRNIDFFQGLPSLVEAAIEAAETGKAVEYTVGDEPGEESYDHEVTIEARVERGELEEFERRMRGRGGGGGFGSSSVFLIQVAVCPKSVRKRSPRRVLALCLKNERPRHERSPPTAPSPVVAPQATTARDANRSPGSGVFNLHVIAIGSSPSCLTYAAGPRNQKARSSVRIRAKRKNPPSGQPTPW